jgi:hypothetical protein
MADEQAFEDYLIDELGPRITAAWDEVGRELIEGQGTGQPRGVMSGWIPADVAIEAIDKQRPDRTRPYRYRGGSA